MPLFSSVTPASVGLASVLDGPSADRKKKIAAAVVTNVMAAV
jgi:hypothetical protein